MNNGAELLPTKDQPKNVRFRFWFPEAPASGSILQRNVGRKRVAALTGAGTLLFYSAFKGSKETSDENYNCHPRHSFPRRHSAAAKSVASSHAPGHHAKGVHGASYRAPGHVKNRRGLKSARTVAPGYFERRCAEKPQELLALGASHYVGPE
jgi:hypothetical protein